MRRMNYLGRLFVVMSILVVTSILLVGGFVVPLRSQGMKPAFTEAALFFELNDTDGDLGIHASIDGGTWTDLTITGPNGRALLNLATKANLRTQGLTQLAFESAEPSFEDLAPAEFFARFPQGVYVIQAVAQGGGTFSSNVTLSHVLAARPGNIFLSGVPAADSCSSKPLPTVTSPVLIDWDPVTTSHPTIGASGPVTISRYQVFVEGQSARFSVDLPPTITEVEVPRGITAGEKLFKFEIIARTIAGNNTAVESCFRMQ
jgi:hypothetical protein